MDGEQYHSMFGLLYSQVMMEALGETKTLSEVRNMGALAAPYPFVLYSDLYEHQDFIRGVANASFSGLLWSPELRDAHSREELLRRLQVVVFSVQCLINAWYCPDLPWREFGCEDEVRELLKLRVQPSASIRPAASPPSALWLWTIPMTRKSQTSITSICSVTICWWLPLLPVQATPGMYTCPRVNG